MFELNNKQREFFGLDSVLPNWEKVMLKGDKYRPETILYYDGNIIRKHITSTENEYMESQHNELTENRELLLPKTKKGKPKKLSASELESRTAIGVYLTVNSHGDLLIGNYTSQTTFYSSRWDKKQLDNETQIETIIDNFINESHETHLNEIEEFKNAKRKNVKYKAGDFFAFKISRTEYGFGRILLDVNKLRKKKLIPENHGLNMLMGPPVLVKIYSHKSSNKQVDIEYLKSLPCLPSDYIMDNVLLYGEYEIIGNLELETEEIDFPISYGRWTNYNRPVVFLQWGLIHLEKPITEYKKYITIENENLPKTDPYRVKSNPYGYYGIGWRSKYNTFDILNTIRNNGNFQFDSCEHYQAEYDLRNPNNEKVRNEILKAFGLKPKKSYQENCKLTKTRDTVEVIKEINQY